MHVDEIVRRFGLFGLRAKVAQQHVAAAKVWLARKVNVVALGLNLQGKVKSLHGPRLKGILPPVTRQRNILARIPGDAGRIKRGVQT